MRQAGLGFEEPANRQTPFMAIDNRIGVISAIVVDDQQFPLDARRDAELPHLGQRLVEELGRGSRYRWRR